MAAKLSFVLIICVFTLLIRCNPKVDSSTQPLVTPVSPVTSVTFTGATNLSDPLIPDSITSYQPQFGSANTIRQFPFGLADQSTTRLRLINMLYNGKIVRSYRYHEQGRLAQRTDYYTNGVQIFRQFNYSHGVNGIVSINSQLNKEAPIVEGYPKGSDLLPSASITFTPTTDSLSGLERKTQTEFAVYKSELGLVRSQLRFSSKGVLIWEEIIDEKDKTSQYTLYRPNELGNIVFSRVGALFNRWVTTRFTYDDKPNPFRTTGDPQPVEFSSFRGISAITNLNNALTQSSINSQGGRDEWRYVYEYRSDGYPYRMLSYRNEELTGTIEFVYNQ